MLLPTPLTSLGAVLLAVAVAVAAVVWLTGFAGGASTKPQQWQQHAAARAALDKASSDRGTPTGEHAASATTKAADGSGLRRRGAGRAASGAAVTSDVDAVAAWRGVGGGDTAMKPQASQDLGPRGQHSGSGRGASRGPASSRRPVVDSAPMLVFKGVRASVDDEMRVVEDRRTCV